MGNSRPDPLPDIPDEFEEGLYEVTWFTGICEDHVYSPSEIGFFSDTVSHSVLNDWFGNSRNAKCGFQMVYLYHPYRYSIITEIYGPM